jgi:hypothetical protein
MREVVKMELATLLTVAGRFAYHIGDANGDEQIDLVDVVFLINYVFRDGPSPDPLARGDLTCDDETNLVDIIFLINYLFKNGPAPPASCLTF